MPRDEDPARDVERGDADDAPACPSGTRLEIRACRDGVRLGVLNLAGMAPYEDAPPLAHGIADVVDFEGHDTRHVVAHGVRRAEDHASVGEDEVDGKRHWPRPGGKDDPSDAPRREMMLALRQRQVLE